MATEIKVIRELLKFLSVKCPDLKNPATLQSKYTQA